jgi:hypothetical protein
VSAKRNIDEERILRLDHFFGISRYVGLPNALLGLEWYVDTEFLKEQLSWPDSYYLDIWAFLWAPFLPDRKARCYASGGWPNFTFFVKVGNARPDVTAFDLRRD